MADITFPEFDSKTHLLSSDYFVGYDSVALKEIKVPVNSLIVSLSSTFLKSDTTMLPGASAVDNIVMITQTAYDALLIKPSKTFFIIIN